MRDFLLQNYNIMKYTKEEMRARVLSELTNIRNGATLRLMEDPDNTELLSHFMDLEKTEENINTIFNNLSE